MTMCSVSSQSCFDKYEHARMVCVGYIEAQTCRSIVSSLLAFFVIGRKWTLTYSMYVSPYQDDFVNLERRIEYL